MIFTKAENLHLEKNIEIDYELVERLFNQFYPDFDFVTELVITVYSEYHIILYGKYTNLKDPFNTEFKNLIKESWKQWNVVDFCCIEFERNTSTEWKPYEYNGIFNLKINADEFVDMVSKHTNNGFINLYKEYIKELNYDGIVKNINNSIKLIKISRQLCDNKQIKELHTVSGKLIEEKNSIDDRLLNHNIKVEKTVKKLLNLYNDFE
jgi:hypothetical protein